MKETKAYTIFAIGVLVVICYLTTLEYFLAIR